MVFPHLFLAEDTTFQSIHGWIALKTQFRSSSTRNFGSNFVKLVNRLVNEVMNGVYLKVWYFGAHILDETHSA